MNDGKVVSLFGADKSERLWVGDTSAKPVPDAGPIRHLLGIDPRKVIGGAQIIVTSDGLVHFSLSGALREDLLKASGAVRRLQILIDGLC